jgi:dihydroxyacid dehydratase/phosphogluconate dehydratase
VTDGRHGHRAWVLARQPRPYRRLGQLTMRGHCYDAMVTLAGCDVAAGMMMAMLR